MPDDDQRAGAVRARLTSGGLLLRNVALTFGSQALMIVAGVVAVPLLIHQLGTERFGILTLAWVVIGYANVFDLGLGRALTKLTAEKLGAGRESDIPLLFWTALILLALFGLAGSIVVAALSPWLVDGVLNIPEGLEDETRTTFFLLAGSIPFVLVSSALRGSLEARQRFDLTSAVNVSLSVLSYFGPVLLSLLSRNLAVAVSAVVLSRLIACGVNLWLCLRVDPALREDRQFRREHARPLLSFGGWVTVTSIVGPFVTTVDRFIIGALMTASAVAYYATPYEVVRQLLVVAMSFSTVLFPAFSTTIGIDRARAEALFARGTRAVFIALFPLTLTVVVFAEEILDVWVGAEFAAQSTEVMQWLAAGILMNGLAYVAYGMVQSSRPDLIAKILMCEVPVYLLVFWLLVRELGVEGAAIAWALRVTVDAAILYAVLYRRLGLIGLQTALAIARPAGLAAVAFLLAIQLDHLAAKAVFFVGVLLGFAALAWFRILQRDERTRLRARLRAVRSSA
jgi:O-antigen/teichoic acid export membrane protein